MLHSDGADDPGTAAQRRPPAWSAVWKVGDGLERAVDGVIAALAAAVLSLGHSRQLRLAFQPGRQ